MKISRGVTEQFSPDLAVTSGDEVQAGTLAEPKEFADAGHRVYPPIAD